jgi:hypothetical protein
MQQQLDLRPFSPGLRLKLQRTAAGLTLWELAVRCDTHPARLSELENGRRTGTPDEWRRVFSALRVTRRA